MFNTEKGGYIDEQNRNAYKVWESLEESANLPICPLTWLTNHERCVHCATACAWFDKSENRCGFMSISAALRNMSKNTQYIYKQLEQLERTIKKR